MPRAGFAYIVFILAMFKDNKKKVVFAIAAFRTESEHFEVNNEIDEASTTELCLPLGHGFAELFEEIISIIKKAYFRLPFVTQSLAPLC